MNKQEALKRIEVQKETLIRLTGWAVYVYIEELIKSLDEPEKIKIPQFVADWITHSKNIGRSLFGAMSIFEENTEIKKWMQWADNQETFALAWILGYEVEEEKRYMVKITKTDQYLHSRDNDFFFVTYVRPDDNPHNCHTRKELEEADFGWVFDCEGIEIEEVDLCH